MVIFHCYVSSPEGMFIFIFGAKSSIIARTWHVFNARQVSESYDGRFIILVAQIHDFLVSVFMFNSFGVDIPCKQWSTKWHQYLLVGGLEHLFPIYWE